MRVQLLKKKKEKVRLHRQQVRRKVGLGATAYW